MIRSVIADPTGNLTALVPFPVSRDAQPVLADEIMAASDCEQVGFLEKPTDSRALVRLQMMGGEFCGNAAMSAAAYVFFLSGFHPGEERTIPLEVSGADGLLSCRIRALSRGYEGTVKMPAIREVFQSPAWTRVRMDGITHFIIKKPLEDPEAEAMLRKLALEEPADAVGLLQWANGFMKPLVYVRGTNSMVFETGCGSGSAAIGAAEAAPDGVSVSKVRQKGGTILVTTRVSGGRIEETQITGTVFFR